MHASFLQSKFIILVRNMASTTVHMEKLKHSVTCHLCYELFDDQQRLPKCLPCGHTLCCQCLDRYIKKTLQENYLCPMCQAEFEVPESGAKDFPNNISLKSLLDILPGDDRNNNIEDAAKPVCEQHGCKECSFVCSKCRIGLCNSCITTCKDGPHYDHMEVVDEIDIALAELGKDAETKLEKLKTIEEDQGEYCGETLQKLLGWENMMRCREELM